MHEPALRLTMALNALAAGTIDPGSAELVVTGGSVAHHVADPGSETNPAPGSVSLRIMLGRLAARRDPSMAWQLVFVAPGRLGELRGPVELTRAGVQAGAVVLPHAGGPAFVPTVLGFPEPRGVQWQLIPAHRPAAVPTPSEAGHALQLALHHAEGHLGAMSLPGAPRLPAEASLPPGFSDQATALLNRGLRAHRVAEAALQAATLAEDSHAIARAIPVLTDLNQAALAAISAAVSWPTHAMVEAP